MGFTDDSVSLLSDDDLIYELESRGFQVVTDQEIEAFDDVKDITKAAEKLYLDYMLAGPEFFEKELKKFFNKHVPGVTLR